MRLYEKDGITVPSVTTILKAVSTNEELMQWANIMGFKRKDIKQIQKDTSEFGTLVHLHLQHRVDSVLTEPLIYKDRLEEYRIEKVLENFDRVFPNTIYKTLFTEKEIISTKLGYGGTIDWLAEVYDKFTMLDFKSSSHLYKVYLFQLGGYYNLLEEIGLAQNLKFSGIININEKMCFPNIYKMDTIKRYAEYFNILAEFYTLWNDKLPKPYHSLEDILTV